MTAGTKRTMAALADAYDWHSAPLGPRDFWPATLEAAVQIVMSSRFPMFVWWGPDLINIYNDAYIPMLGKKHPAAFARPAKEVWSEIWDVVGVQADLVIKQRQSTWNQEMLLLMDRHGYKEETYFTWSYSPIGEGDGTAAGLFCAVTEDTSKVIGQRRLRTLRELGTETADLRTAPEAFAAAAKVLSRNPHDIPFALLYEASPDGDTATLAGSAGLDDSRSGLTDRLALDPGSNPWGLGRNTDEIRVITDLDRYFDEVPPGPWPTRPVEALVLPFAGRGETKPAGFMIAGISCYIRLSDEYRGFLTLVAGHIAAAVANSRAYEAERRRAEALAEIDRAKTSFFSNVSHEFRTPLTLMIAPLEEMLDAATERPAIDRERLETAHRNSLRLLKLVNTLLDFSRIEAGRVQAIYEATDLVAITKDISSVFRSAIEKAGLRFTIDIPPLGEPVYVDPEMWEKIVLNLLSNAFKFTFEGEIGVSLRVECGTVRLTVSDTGTGIPVEELPHLFERFHRVRGARGRSFEGSGIGLALIQELVRLHGGTVAAESEIEQGSQFTVSIPLGRAHLPQDRIGIPGSQSTAARTDAFVQEALRMLPTEKGGQSEGPAVASTVPQTSERPPLSTAAGTRPRIVVVDDNADMRAYTARLLGQEYDVTAASDGTAALEVIQANPPDLILTDLMMPKIDGCELLRALRSGAGTRDLPVIILTARAGEEARIEGLEMGADEYLTKPFSARELLARVEATLKLQRVRAESNRALRESEARYRTLFNSMEEGFCTVEIIFDEDEQPIDYRFLEVNEAFGRLTGIRDAKGKRMREIAPDHEDNWFEIYGRVALTGEPARFENEAKRLGRWYEVYAFRVDDPDLRRIAIVFNDITERRRREEQLRRTNRDLEQFAYSASHDLQEPIRSVGIYSELLAARGQEKLDSEELQFLEYIRGGAQRMGLLVRDLLTYTQVVNREAEPGTGDCNEVLKGVLSNLDGAIHASDALVTTDELPTLAVNPIHLQQLFQNLIGNAIKYRSGERRPAIHVSAVYKDAFWLFSVSDNGIGIEPQYRDRIFGLFKRLHSGPEYTGTGLGLAICQRIVERYNGRIWVESEPGQGSTFRFTLAS